MVNESTTFGLSTLVTAVGLAIMLYGVTVTAGESLHPSMVLGGVIVLAAISLQTAGLMRLEDAHGHE